MISHDYKLIFIHIPKCAGRSIVELFNQRFDHHTANYYMQEYLPKFLNYELFTIVRNPYERYVSMWRYIKTHRRHHFEDIYNQRSNDEREDFKRFLLKNIELYKGEFSPISAEGARGTDGDLGSSFWFSSQYSRISNTAGYRMVKNVFKLESDIDAIQQYLSNVMNKEIVLPHNNKSDHKEWQYYYDAEILDKLSRFRPLQIDCKMLNYDVLTKV